MIKAHRTHQGQRYCGACYKRLFKQQRCPRCGNAARLPKDDPRAVCASCKKDAPCARCGKTSYALGKFTPYGPVCASCAPYFREPKPCGLCGKPSSRLSRVKSAGIDVPVCPSCASRDRGTCKACRRHRRLLEAPDGRALCRPCLEQGDKLCPSCGGTMPAGRGEVCETCYWRRSLRKRVTLDQAAFGGEIMRRAFSEFGEWLLTEVGEQKATRTIHRYLPFFTEVERQWGKVPNYASLLEHFGAEGLRRVRLPMRWLTLTHGVAPSAPLREENSERRRVEDILASLPGGTISAGALVDYWEHLSARMQRGRTSLRSARLALGPALALLLAADAAGVRLPDQATLDRYLRDAPGQKAAVTGFVLFLNKKHDLGLAPRVEMQRVREERRKRLEGELLALMRHPPREEQGYRQWLGLALAFFHDLPRSVGKKLDLKQVAAQEDGLKIEWQEETYWIPSWTVDLQLPDGLRREELTTGKHRSPTIALGDG